MNHNVTLWPAQKEFFAAGPQPTVYMGGVGAGKTYIGILKILALLDQYPGSRAAIVRQRFRQLKLTTAKTLWKLLPREHIAGKNENDGTLRLKNGSEIVLFHLDKADSIINLKSMELNFAYVDQLEDISAEAWDTLDERIGRWSGASRRGGWPANWPYKDLMGNCIPPRYLFASSYSPGFDHWVTQRWWEHGSERDRYAAKGYKVITGSTRENKALSQDYVDGRLAMGSEYVKRFVDAVEWGAREGRIFDISPLSIIDPDPDFFHRMKRKMRLHRVYDHGEFSPAACIWYAADDRGNIFIYREYMKADALVSEHRRTIFEMSREDGYNGIPPSYHSNLADPVIFNLTRGRSAISAPTWSVADEWTDTSLIEPETVVHWRGADNNEAMSISRIKEYLRVDPRHNHPLTGKKGAPRLYFIRRTDAYPLGCHEVIADVRNARREEIGTAPDGSKLFGNDRDERVRDHLLDCVRYAANSRPSRALRAEEPDQAGSIDFNRYLNQGKRDDFLVPRFRHEQAPPSRRYGYGR